MGMDLTPELQRVVEAWELGDISAVTPVTAGHINVTYFVDAAGGRFVLQRLSAIFAPEVNRDIEAITATLQRAGLTTPRLVRTADRNLWHTDEKQQTWRVLTFIDGEVVESADGPERCFAAGRFLGRFHRALWSSDHAFEHQRLGVHDTPKHLAALRQALEGHANHRLFGRIEPLAEAILEQAEALTLRDATWPERIVHGDPKITNIVFASADEARCLVDLDTLARMPLHLELGDALRSWCCPLGEDVDNTLDLAFFEAALSGYAEQMAKLLEPAERSALTTATELIAIELAARFCADALCESYFGWDKTRFDSAAEHNIRRASAQLYLARSARRARPQIQALVDRLLSVL